MLILEHRIAFYYRIFPFRQFRNILLVVAALSLGYGISIDVTILFQWSVDRAPSPLKIIGD